MIGHQRAAISGQLSAYWNACIPARHNSAYSAGGRFSVSDRDFNPWPRRAKERALAADHQRTREAVTGVAGALK